MKDTDSKEASFLSLLHSTSLCERTSPSTSCSQEMECEELPESPSLFRAESDCSILKIDRREIEKKNLNRILKKVQNIPQSFYHDLEANDFQPIALPHTLNSLNLNIISSIQVRSPF
jgi:hypothetical protein